MRRTATLVCLALTLTVLAGCQTAKVGTRCRNGAAQDRTHVLLCKNGRWTRWVTRAQGQRMLAAYLASRSQPPADPRCNKRGYEADLHGCNLTGVNLSGAYLVGANFTDANLTRANLTGADISYAVLTRANLTDATVTGANIGSTCFCYSNLTRTNLAGARNADGMTWREATFAGTTMPDGSLLTGRGAPICHLAGPCDEPPGRVP